MNYFAYGSNMSFKVISSRINKVQFLFVGFLPNHKMLCNKRSLDGSGKANIAYHPCDVTWGVIYKIDSKYMNNLDRIEGGYERKTFRIITSTEDIPADAYISYNLTNALPDLSYKETIIMVPWSISYLHPTLSI